MPKKIEVLVADDSSIMRHILSDILTSDSDLSVAGMASNGLEAVRLTNELDPDVILMDLNMGEYDGLYAIENIMRDRPRPIVMISGNTPNEEVLGIVKKLGAFDFMLKPIWQEGGIKGIGLQLVDKIKEASSSFSRVEVVTDELKVYNQLHNFGENSDYELLAMGASTGGPSAIEKVIANLPGNFPIPVLIAQHMPANFIPSFAARLNGLTNLTVQVAKAGVVVKPGNIYIAPGRNMIIRRNQSALYEISFSNKVFPEFNNPSINALFESVQAATFGQCIGVILTGMGRDGADGIEKIYKSGGMTIAQDENTSVVYGMPKEAVNTGGVQHVIPIGEIGFFIVSCITS